MTILVQKTLLTLFVVLALTSGAFAQGSITPTGTPGATMKSLDQIEPRTRISSLPFTIGTPGSYYLTASLNVTAGNAITINANNVTVDLNGFTLSSTEASPAGTGILLSGNRSHIHIQNGHIRGNVVYSAGSYSGSGFANGISYTGTLSSVRVTNVSVSGCSMHGINVGFGTSRIVESCTADTVGGNGLHADTVSNSVAYQSGMSGITAVTVNNSSGHTVGSGSGVDGETVTNCYGYANTNRGIRANGTATNCFGQSNTGRGLSAKNASGCFGLSATGIGLDADMVSNCFGQSNSNYGIYSYVATNSYGYSVTNGTGLYAFGNATNCTGESGGSGNGLEVEESALNCLGTSSTGTGLLGINVMNCTGRSGSGTGLAGSLVQNSSGSTNSGSDTFHFGIYAGSVAIGCYGSNPGAGLAIAVQGIAVSCIAAGGQSDIGYSYHYNMPP